MKKYKGKVIHEGRIQASAFKFIDILKVKTMNSFSTIENEIKILMDALSIAKEEVLVIANQALELYGEDVALVFKSHSLMIDDPFINNQVIDLIKNESLTAEAAYRIVQKKVIKQFSELEHGYIRERTIDIEDITERVLRKIIGDENLKLPMITKDSIIILKKIKPSTIFTFRHERVKGFITENGSYEAHSSKIARQMEIPSMIVKNIYDNVNTDDIVLIDTDEKSVIIK